MQLLDTLQVRHGAEEKLIELYQGDLTSLGPDQGVDVLVVSAFPDDYLPVPGTLIGALARKGVSVDLLARNKAVDLRSTDACWLSQEIAASDPGIRFRRIVCFEPRVRGTPPSVVGDIFRALTSFVAGNAGMSSVAMPIVASGNQRFGVAEMFPPLLDAAVHWMALGHPLNRLKIVAFGDDQAREAKELFGALKQEHALPRPAARRQEGPEREPGPGHKYDVFISYAHEDAAAASLIVDELRRLKPDVRIFLDRLSLRVGMAWQPEIFEAIDACERILAVFSPAYLASKVCKEEFNIAWVRSRDAGEDYLFPLYLYSAPLPTYMRYRLYSDCREGNGTRVRAACAELLAALSGAGRMPEPPVA